MNLDNMRANGVSAVEASCFCGRRAVVNVAHLHGSITVPSLRARLRCLGCGDRPADVRPNWLGRLKPGAGMGC